MPCLFSELKGTALPNIVKEISKTKYLNHIIIGLDKADEKDVKFAFSFFRKLKLPFSYTSSNVTSFTFIIFWRYAVGKSIFME